MSYHEKAPTTDQLMELGAILLRQVPKRLSASRVQYLIEHPKETGEILQNLAGNVSVRTVTGIDIDDMLLQWERFYWRHFGRHCDFSSLKVPAPDDGFKRLIVVAGRLQTIDVVRACYQKFQLDSDKYLSQGSADNMENDRDTKSGAYAIWARHQGEADAQFADESAERLWLGGFRHMTFMERMLFELKYYDESGDHLDITTETLCVGSQSEEGLVPGVCFRDGAVRVRLYSMEEKRPDLCARSVVV